MVRLWQNLNSAWKSLGSNPLRTLLTVLGVIIGVAAVITLTSLGEGASRSVTSSIQGLGSNLLMITPGEMRQGSLSLGSGSARSLTMGDCDYLTAVVPELSAVAPQSTARSRLVWQRNNYQAQVVGSTPSLAQVRHLSLTHGRFFTALELERASKVAVVGQGIVDSLFGGSNPLGQTIYVDGLPFKVIGVLVPSAGAGFMSFDDQVIVPITTLARELTGQEFLSSIYASAAASVDTNLAQAKVEQALRASHHLRAGEANDFNLVTQEAILNTMDQVISTLTLFLGSIAAISLVVGGIGIMNIMVVAVAERTREIGLRKALGATSRDVLLQFLTEAGFISLSGGVAGIILGWGASSLIGGAISIQPVISPAIVFLASGFSLLMGIIFGVYPAYRASRLNPIDALRHE